MIFINETNRPIFCGRRDRKRIKRRGELMCQDATGVIIACLCGVLAAVILLALASPYATKAVGWMVDNLPELWRQ